MASSLPLHQTPAPPRRPTHSVAPLQKHKVFTVQAADTRTRTQASGAPDKPRPDCPQEPSRPLFDGLQPIVYTGAALGIVPISFRPLRVSFHPARSTLPYALLVQAYTWWGAFFEMPWSRHVPSPLDGAAVRFWNMHSTLHLAGVLIVLVFWAEAGNIHQLRALCDTLLEDFGYVLWGRLNPTGHAGSAGRLRPRTPQRCVVWFTTAALFIVGPVMYLAWALVVETKRNIGKGMPHVFVNFLLAYAVAVPAICCLRLRTFATGLLSALRQELADPGLTPERVLEYRRTWTHLTNLSSGFIVTPVSMLLVTVLLVILATLHSYETVERLTAGEAEVGIWIWIIGVPFLFLLFVLCEVPHRSADVIRRRFMDVLQMSYCRYRNDRSYNELHRFLEIIWWNSPVMTISGYFELQRSSFKAIVTVIVTYVIVILQFHLSINNSAELNNRLNGTQAMLSVNESGTATVTNKPKTLY